MNRLVTLLLYIPAMDAFFMNETQSQEEIQPLAQEIRAVEELPNKGSGSQENLSAQITVSQELDTNALQITFAVMSDTISRLKADFETKIKYDESKERTIDALHRELQDYREDLSFKILRPLIMDLVGLYDDIHLLVKKYSSQQQCITDSDIYIADFNACSAEIEEIVNRYGFEFYQTETDLFDRSLQKTHKAVNTDNFTLDKQIIERVRRGLRYGERVVRPEAVTAYRYVSSGSSTLAGATP